MQRWLISIMQPDKNPFFWVDHFSSLGTKWGFENIHIGRDFEKSSFKVIFT